MKEVIPTAKKLKLAIAFVIDLWFGDIFRFIYINIDIETTKMTVTINGILTTILSKFLSYFLCMVIRFL